MSTASFCWLLITVAAAPTDPVVPPADQIRKALDQPISLDEPDQPLPHVLNVLSGQIKVPIVLDRTALLNFVAEEETKVTLKVRDVKARTALRSAVAQYNLSYGIVGDAIVVSTPEVVIYRQLRQPVSLDIDAVPINVALKQLARQSGANLLLDPRLKPDEGKKPVTLQIEEVPLETAVRLLAEMADLKVARLGNVLMVTDEERAQRLRSEPADLVAPPVPGGGLGGFDTIRLGQLVAPVPAPPAAAPAIAPAAAQAIPNR